MRKTLDTKLDVRQALRAFEKITRHGSRKNDSYRLDGITAEPSFDGYTVMLRNREVELYIYFHNKYKFEYKNIDDVNDFIRRITKIDSTDY